MHFYHFLGVSFVLLSLVADAAVGPAYARRRDVSTTSVIQDSQAATQTTAPNPSTTGSSGTDSPAVSSTTSMIDIHTDISNPQPSIVSSLPQTSNGTIDINALPIEPTITPSIGITGVVLIIAGLAYSIIGIKNQGLHVFLSTAFLASLSVTVLIEYVMSPPVSNAIQGAYFVAAFLTGLIFGALSLIFKELTEGLGCLLGGFCLSMWLLSLKRGGLLTSSETRGAFIGAFCVAFYALSFSSYTRPYGLIVSTAFAGSTITVLGIDCFSRAGWKEFWLYIWGLNGNLFPFGTSTYPVTRGIRVELAVTVVICLFGLLSQFRLWKLIRERRKKQEELLAEERRKKDEAELELGRTLEEKKVNDLVRWEAMYGGSAKSNSTAAQSSTSDTHQTRHTPEPVEVPDNSVEMMNLPTSAHDKSADKDISEEGADQSEKSHDNQNEPATTEGLEAPPDPETSNADKDIETTNGEDDQTTVNKVIESPASPPPPVSPCVTPLPFTVPLPQDKASNHEDDGHSVQVVVDDVDSNSVRTSRRLSTVSLLRQLSHRNDIDRSNSGMRSESGEMFVPATRRSSTSSGHVMVDSDVGSNLGVGHDIEINTEIHDTDSRSNNGHNEAIGEDIPFGPVQRPPSALLDESDIPQDVKNTAPHIQSVENRTATARSVREKISTENKEADACSGVVSDRRRHTFDGATSDVRISKPPTSVVMKKPTSRPIDSISERDVNIEKSGAALSSSKSKSSASKKEDLTSEIVKRLPSHVSPVVMSYRTNEWAKHLSHADAPEPEPLEELMADTERSVSVEAVEVAAPLNIKELKQTALTASPAPVNERRESLTEKIRQEAVEHSISNSSSQSSREVNSRQSVHEHMLIARAPSPSFTQGITASSSTPALHTSSRSPQSRNVTHGLRSVSTPLLSTSLAAPALQTRHSLGQVAEEESFPLMAQREKMIQARHSSISLTRDSWAPRNKSRQSVVEGHPSRPESQLSMVEDDDMPLTQRRVLLQQRALSPPLAVDVEARRTPVDRPPIVARLSRQASKPKTSTSMAAWRESLHEDSSKHKPLLDVDLARNELMEQQRRAQMARHQRRLASEDLHNSIAERMRHGDMQDLHREAMRRMQASANRRTSNSP